MVEPSRYFIERHVGDERAILVQMYLPGETEPGALEEFKALVDSDEIQILSVITGRLNTPNPKYFVGKGKIEEIRNTVRTQCVEVIFFNHELTPAQERNLEQYFNCRVLDRTGLILDIFAKRARTYEGKLQVELAQLDHLKTRLVHGWAHLERQKGGIGLRGPGEKQLETDRRLVNFRIKTIKKRLAKVIRQRNVRRRARKRAAIPMISIVGYTNAGKSTLFNRLTESDVFVADQLFATLDPTLRHMVLPGIGKVILADTVGFIRDLPHGLIAAFKATLEETRQADLLLHVIDAQEENSKIMIQSVNSVLKEINANKVPQLQVYNKVDLSNKYQLRIDRNFIGRPERVWISALTGDGMNLLHQALVECLLDQVVYHKVVLEPSEGKLRAKLYDMQVVESEKIDEQGRYVLDLKIQRSDYEKLFL